MRTFIKLVMLFSYFQATAQTKVWTVTFTDAKEIISFYECQNDKILVGTEDLKGTAWLPENTLYRYIDSKTGEIEWSKPYEEFKNSKISYLANLNQHVIQLVTDSLLARYKINLPVNFLQAFVSPRLVELKDRVLVYNQKAALLFDKSAGGLIYSLPLEDNEIYNLEYIKNKAAAIGGSYNESTFGKEDPTINAFKAKADYNVAHHTNSVTDLSISAIGGVGNVFSSILIAKMNLGREFIIRDQLANATAFYSKQFVFPYFIWFSYKNGWTIHFLNCTTFKTAAVSLGAANPNYRMYGEGKPFFHLSQDGKNLFTFFFSDKTYSQSAISFANNVDINYLSLVKFDLTDMPFSETPTKDLDATTILDKEQKLFKYILANKTDSVKSIIKAGADVNFRFKGVTPLIVAATGYKPDIIELLLKADADATIGDIHGWVPWHYAVMSGFNSPLVTKLGKAYKRKSDGKPGKR